MKKTIWLLILFFLAGCHIFDPSDIYEYTYYSIPALYLEIDPDDLGELNSELYSQMYVPADIYFQGDSYHVSVRNQGGISREYSKRNYQLKFDYFSNAYFPPTDKIIISSQSDDKSMMRTMLASRVFRSAGFDVFNHQHIAFFINREYAGLYLLLEPVDENYYSNQNISFDAYFEAKNSTMSFSTGIPINCQFSQTPDSASDVNLVKLIHILDTANAADLPSLLTPLIDVTNFLDYIAASVLVAHIDSEFKNYTIYQETGGLMKITPWDFDWTYSNSSMPFSLPNNLNRLLEVPEYYDYCADKIGDLVDDTFATSGTQALITETVDRLSGAYLNDPYLQAGGFSLDDEAAKLVEFITARTNYLYGILEGD